MRTLSLLIVMCALGACAQQQASDDRVVPGLPWPVSAASTRGLSDAQVQALYVRWRNGERAPAPTYSVPRPSSTPTYDVGTYAGPSIFSEPDERPRDKPRTLITDRGLITIFDED